jgi:hypothetical protein
VEELLNTLAYWEEAEAEEEALLQSVERAVERTDAEVGWEEKWCSCWYCEHCRHVTPAGLNSNTFRHCHLLM